jgi:hypothetical protein
MIIQRFDFRGCASFFCVTIAFESSKGTGFGFREEIRYKSAGVDARTTAGLETGATLWFGRERNFRLPGNISKMDGDARLPQIARIFQQFLQEK